MSAAMTGRTRAIGRRAARRATRRAALLATAGVLALAAIVVPSSRPAQALEPVYSNEDVGGAREIKACILLLQSTAWENPEPFFLPTLATENPALSKVRTLRPGNWRMVNPLAPEVVTPDIQNLWDAAYNGAITFDGVSAVIENDRSGSVDIAANQQDYNGGPGNPGGPNSYLAHAQPQHLAQFGFNGTNSNNLPALGQPIPKEHPAYWEVPLTPRTVSQLASFDAVFVNTHRNLEFSREEQTLLRQFLDAGGTLYLEDSHGSRLVATGDPTDANNVNFFLKFQFVDGWPYMGSYPTRPDGYPINNGGLSTGSYTRQVVAPQHPLLNVLHRIPPSEAVKLGDLPQAKDHLIIRETPAIYQVEEILRTTNTDAQWGTGNPSGTPEPAVAVAHLGGGRVILSAVDMIDDCSKPYETGQEPTDEVLPDIKFMFNLLAWRSGASGHRRGGVANSGIAATRGIESLSPRFVWHFPAGGPGPNFYGPNIDSYANSGGLQTALATNLNAALKEPLVSSRGIVYVQYQYGNNYYLAAIDGEPERDLEGNGIADDGFLDMTLDGATFDTIWVNNMGQLPITGATVSPVTHQAKNVSIDVLLLTQPDPANNRVRLWAYNATVDDSINQGMSPAENPGDPFYNWTAASGVFSGSGPGYVDLPVPGGMRAAHVSAPVVYDDLVYVTASYAPAALPAGAAEGQWARLMAVRLVPIPSVVDGGTMAWAYPDFAYPGSESPLAPGVTDPNIAFLQYNLLRQVDAQQNRAYAVGAPENFIPDGGGAGSDWQYLAGSSPVVPTLDDPTHLMPVVGLVRDERTGLTAPTAFINRANGDVWAISAAPEALGWRLEGDVIPVDPGAVGPPVRIPATGPAAFVADSVTPVNSGAVTVGHDVYDGGTLIARFRKVFRGAIGNQEVVATEVTLPPDVYRAQALYSEVRLHFERGGSPQVANKTILPRHRLLRQDRNSGYSTSISGPAVLMGWSTSAPMLVDTDTLVSSSSALWYSNQAPSATYEPGSNATIVPGTPYQTQTSGMLSFFRVGGDSLQVRALNQQNHYDPIRWVFDAANVAPGLAGAGQLPIIDDNLAGGPADMTPAPETVPQVSLYGAPTRYNGLVATTGALHDPASGGEPIAGVVAGVDPHPVLSAEVYQPGSLTDLQEGYPTYVIAVDPTAFTFDQSAANPPGAPWLPSYWDTEPGTPGLQPTERPLRQYVVDPAQYSLDYVNDRISLRADLAHMTRYAQPLPDVHASGEPFPEAARLPLYGRVIYLVQDYNADGFLNANDGVAPVFVPSPARWAHVPGHVFLDLRARMLNPPVVRLSGGAVLTLNTDYFIDDPARPHLIRFAPAYQGDEVTVTYDMLRRPGVVTVSEKHKVAPAIPGLRFSPIVAGDKLFVSGTQINGQAGTLPQVSSAPGTIYSAPAGGVYAFRFGRDNHVIDVQRLLPETVPGWPNYNPDSVAASYVRGLPVASDEVVFVSFGVIGSGGNANNQFAAPLYALGTNELLVTENLRLAWVDYNGTVVRQLAGTKERNGAARPSMQTSNTPNPTDLLTTLLARPSRAYNLDSSNVLLVDTGNDRVVELDTTGTVQWPLDTAVGAPEPNVLRYLGLREFGLKRPSDAARYRIAAPVHPGSSLVPQIPLGTVIGKDVTVIADKGNRRIVMTVTYPETRGGGTATFYEPLSQAAGAPQNRAWRLTAPQVFNPATQQWIQLPVEQVQAWDPQVPGEPAYNAAASTRDTYVSFRMDGYDQLFAVDPDAGDNGDFDDNDDGTPDAIVRNLDNLYDPWTGQRIFRGLRGFHRFRIGGRLFLATIQASNNNPNTSTVNVWEFAPGAGLSNNPVWTFTRPEYLGRVYDDDGAWGAEGAGDTATSYYERALLNLRAMDPAREAQLRALWAAVDAGTGQSTKLWNPVAVTYLPNQKRLAIVNGAANTVNQIGSNSEVLIVKFDPNDLADRRVEHVLPDLARSANAPAGLEATRRRADQGGYPVSSPVHVDL